MITLNTERGLVRVDSWSDVESLPGFTSILDPHEHKLSDVIGRYVFKEYIPCGLSNCRQKHGKGYVVSTKTGAVTNIGHRCGQTHFGIDFDKNSKRFERMVSEQNYRETIGSFLMLLDEYEDTLSRLRSGCNGADSINRKVSKLTITSQGAIREIDVVRSPHSSLKPLDPALVK